MFSSGYSCMCSRYCLCTNYFCYRKGTFTILIDKSHQSHVPYLVCYCQSVHLCHWLATWHHSWVFSRVTWSWPKNASFSVFSAFSVGIYTCTTVVFMCQDWKGAVIMQSLTGFHLTRAFSTSCWNIPYSDFCCCFGNQNQALHQRLDFILALIKFHLVRVWTFIFPPIILGLFPLAVPVPI